MPKQSGDGPAINSGARDTRSRRPRSRVRSLPCAASRNAKALHGEGSGSTELSACRRLLHGTGDPDAFALSRWGMTIHEVSTPRNCFPSRSTPRRSTLRVSELNTAAGASINAGAVDELHGAVQWVRVAALHLARDRVRVGAVVLPLPLGALPPSMGVADGKRLAALVKVAPVGARAHNHAPRLISICRPSWISRYRCSIVAPTSMHPFFGLVPRT